MLATASRLRAAAQVALAQEGVVDLDVIMRPARAPQGPADAAHRLHEVLARGGREPDRVGDLLDRVAGAVERGDGLLGSQTDRKLGGGHPRLLSGVWVVGPGGVDPGFAHGRSPVGRNVREAGTASRRRRPTPLVRWPLPVMAGLVGP